MNYRPTLLKLNLSVMMAVLCFVPLAAQSQSTAGPAGGRTTPSSTIFDELADKAGLRFRHYNGMTGKLFLPEVMGAGAAMIDFDNDGDLDVFLVQGSVLEPGDEPQRTLFPWREPAEPRARLFRNDLVAGRDGNTRLQFTDVTERSGIRANGYGMGVIVGDLNNDGWPDIYLCNMGPNHLYLNNGNGTFTDVTARAGADDRRWTTSAAMFDYDRDGWLDIFVVNYANFTVVASPASAPWAIGCCTIRATARSRT
jgi:hypothetical protein